MKLNIGDNAPDFELPSTSGGNFRLSDNLKHGKLVLYFYPRDFTSGCTAEACGFRDAHEELDKLGMRVVGISTDSVETHFKFKEKHGLPFEILADNDGKISKLYGVYNGIFRFANRVTFVINEDGRIESVTKNLLSPGKHIAAAKAVGGAK